MSRKRVLHTLEATLRSFLPRSLQERRQPAANRLERLDAEQRARLAANLQKLIRPKEATTARAVN